MDIDSDYDDGTDDSELIRLLMNEKKDSISVEDANILEERRKLKAVFINLHNVQFDTNTNAELPNEIEYPRSVESACIISSDEENDNEIIREIELIAPTATSETDIGDDLSLNNVIVNCIQDENVKNNLFRLNEQLESNFNKCKIVAAEATATSAEKMALIRDCKKIEDKILKYSVEEARLKKIRKKKGKDSAETGHHKNTYFCRFGMPYFKSRERFPADYNRDYREILSSQQILLFRLPKTRRFLKKDALNLDSLVLNQLKKKRIAQLNQYLKNINKSLISNEGEHDADEIYEKKKKIYDAIIETNHVSNLQDSGDWSVNVDFMDFIKENNYRYSAEDYERMWNLLGNPSLSREEFSTEETNKLKMLIDQLGAQDWDRIAYLLGTKRSGFMCFTKYAAMNRKGKNVPWTPEEDELMRKLCNKLSIMKKPGSRYHWWKYIRRHFPNRTYGQIHSHWSYVLAPKLKKGKFSDDEHNAIEQMVKDGKSFSQIAKIFGNRACVQIRSHYEQSIQFTHLNSGPWTKDEENMLLELIREYGDKNWVAISRRMKTRTRIQCRLKYMQLKKHPIQPESAVSHRKGRWSEEENVLFIKLFEKYGRQWAEISKIMKTRSRNQCYVKFCSDINVRKILQQKRNFHV